MNLGMEPSQWAEMLATNSIAAMKARLSSQQKRVGAEQTALSALKTALDAFRTTLKEFGSKGEVVSNAATANLEGYVTLKADGSASKGLYEINVTETAAAQQNAFENLTDDVVKGASGMLSVSVGGKSLDLDVTNINSMAELRDAINRHADNPGVTASLMKVNGENRLTMGSEETGVANSFSVSVVGDAAFKQAMENGSVISAARDAEITVGNLTINSSSNTFRDLIPGVEISVVQKTDPARPLIISVGNDETKTKEQAQKFVDAWNTLTDKLDELTRSGGEKAQAGALAGDSSLRVLEQQMTSLLRKSVNGNSLADFGIELDKKGKLTLDSETFLEAVNDNPQVLNTLFGGTDGLIKQLDKGLNSFLSVTGSIKSRQDSLDRQTSQLSSKEIQIQARYDTYYNRYLKEFTRVQSAMQEMENTMAQFFG